MQSLTQIEMFISAVLSIMSLYHLPHGQYGYSGHVINLIAPRCYYLCKQIATNAQLITIPSSDSLTPTYKHHVIHVIIIYARLIYSYMPISTDFLYNS